MPSKVEGQLNTHRARIEAAARTLTSHGVQQTSGSNCQAYNATSGARDVTYHSLLGSPFSPHYLGTLRSVSMNPPYEQGNQYAINDNHAEKAGVLQDSVLVDSESVQDGQEKTSKGLAGALRGQEHNDRGPDTKPSLVSTLRNRFTWRRGERDTDDKLGEEFENRRDADIWKLYLEDVEKDAREKAALWATGLDSLLIFAGLFAGVVAGFVIDIRSELQPDRAPRLLSDILDFLRNVPSTDTSSGTPESVYWIHGLWIISLLFTILSALLGVLAKSWLVKYTPDSAANRVSARDAYKRYELEKRAKRWLLKEVLVLAPLLVQIASFLFLIGLIIQSLGDVPPIGRALMIICIISSVGYLIMTVLPLVVPSFIFVTPMGEFLLTVKTSARRSRVQAESPFGPGISGGLKDIMFNELLAPGKPAHIDAVVAEVVLPGAQLSWVEHLCVDNAPAALFSRLQECVTSKTMNAAERDELAARYLLVFLSCAEAYGKFSMRHPNDYKRLNEVFQELLDLKGLYRSSILPPNVKQLSFALRANLLVLLPKSPSYSLKMPYDDFSEKELVNRPWEVAFKEVPPIQRLQFALACFRGLVQGKKNLKRTSAFVLCLRIAKGSSSATEAGELIEYESSVTAASRQSVETLVMVYLSKLYEATVSGWEGAAFDALRSISSPLIPQEVERHDEHVVPRLLLLSLARPNTIARALALSLTLLKHWACQTAGPPPGIDKIRAGELEHISKLAISDNQGLQGKALSALVGIINAAQGTVLHPMIGSTLSRCILSEMDSTEGAQKAVKFIDKISANMPPSSVNVLFHVLTEVVKSPKGVDGLILGGLTVDQARQNFAKAPNDESVTSLKNAILEYLSQAFDSDSDPTLLLQSLYHLVNAAEDAKSLPFWAFPWDHCQSELIRQVLNPDTSTEAERRFAKVVALATGDARKGVVHSAQQLLKLLCTEGSSYSRVVADSVPQDLKFDVDAVQPTSVSRSAVEVVRWVKLLAMISHRPDLRAGERTLFQQIAASFKAVVNLQAASDGNHPATGQGITTSARSGGPTSKWDRTLNLLARYGFDNRIRWLEIFPVISAKLPQEFPDAADLLINVALRFQAYDAVPSEALRGLLSLGKEGMTSIELQNVLLSNFGRLACSDYWKVRVNLPGLLAGFGISTRLPAHIFDTLSSLASSDPHDGVRFGVVKVLARVQSVTVGAGGPATASQPSPSYRSTEDKQTTSRQYWLESVGREGEDVALDPLPRIVSIIDVAIKDSSDLVRSEAIKIVCQLRDDLDELRRTTEWKIDAYAYQNPPMPPPEDVIALRDSLMSQRNWLALRIGQSTTKVAMDKGHGRYTSSASLLAGITARKGEAAVEHQDSHPFPYPLAETLPPEHDTWVRVAMFLAKHGANGVPEHIAMTVNNRADRTVQQISTMLGGEILDKLWVSLSRSDRSGVVQTQKAKTNNELECVNVLTSLLRCEDPHGLLGAPGDLRLAKIMARLAEMSVQDEDPSLRMSALHALKISLVNPQFRALAERRWSQYIEACLSEQPTIKSRMNVLWTLSQLTSVKFVDFPKRFSEQDTLGAHDSLNNIVLPHIKLCLTLVLFGKNGAQQVDLRKHAELILIENIKAYSHGLRLRHEVVSTIVTMIPDIPVEGRHKALSIVDALNVEEDTILPIANALLSSLHDSGVLQRVCSLELLSSLYNRYQPPITGSAVREVIGLAVTDSADEVRVKATELLSALASPIPLGNATRSPPFQPTVKLAAQFMSLLQTEALRPSAIELLCIMSANPEVRNAITLQIIAASFEPHSPLLEGYTALLARLLSDGRLEGTTMDKVLIFLASAIVTRPEVERHRFDIHTALWCRYGAKKIVTMQETPQTDNKGGRANEDVASTNEATTSTNKVPMLHLKAGDGTTEQLAKWFSFAIFGKTVSESEANKFLERSGLCVDSVEIGGLVKALWEEPAKATKGGAEGPEEGLEDVNEDGGGGEPTGYEESRRGEETSVSQ